MCSSDLNVAIYFLLVALVQIPTPQSAARKSAPREQNRQNAIGLRPLSKNARGILKAIQAVGPPLLKAHHRLGCELPTDRTGQGRADARHRRCGHGDLRHAVQRLRRVVQETLDFFLAGERVGARQAPANADIDRNAEKN